jgi:hypothetical protein
MQCTWHLHCFLFATTQYFRQVDINDPASPATSPLRHSVSAQSHLARSLTFQFNDEMAGSRYAYVRNFELPDPVLPNCFMVVRIDGKGFHKCVLRRSSLESSLDTLSDQNGSCRFSALHNFIKPNDAPALELMNEAARHVLRELKGEVVLAFGESDEYSFLLKRSCTLYSRRER